METPSDNTLRTPRPWPWAAWCAVFASFLIFSAVRSPVPGVNEPHYLCKAKHYWNPAWCTGDFFLDSSNPHQVFYQTVGFFTQVLSLEQTAWLGRVVSLSLLAWGWIRLVPHLAPGRWTSLWAAWMYLALAAVGNWSGEWMVGGVEAKVFSYGLGFWAMAAWLERNIKIAATLAGLGVSFHPVVGGWIVIAGTAATLVTSLFPARPGEEQNDDPPSIPMIDWALALGIFILACLPGILPVLSLVDSGDLKQTQIVTWIQVFYRLQHHLDPMTFSQGRNISYALMAVLWAVLRFRLGWGAAERWFAWCVAASAAIALAGVALGYGDRPIESLKEITWRYRLLKYYPFRLADVLLPMAAAITLAGLAAHGLRDGFAKLWGNSTAARVRCWLIFCCLFLFAILTPAIDSNPSRMSAEQLRDWKDVCRWIREETPAGSVIWTPPNSWAFKWYAHRAEYVARKDCPQDAEGIIEWHQRMRHSLSEALKNEPRLNYAVIRKGRLPIEPIYENETYRIFDLAAYARK